MARPVTFCPECAERKSALRRPGDARWLSVEHGGGSWPERGPLPGAGSARSLTAESRERYLGRCCTARPRDRRLGSDTPTMRGRWAVVVVVGVAAVSASCGGSHDAKRVDCSKFDAVAPQVTAAAVDCMAPTVAARPGALLFAEAGCLVCHMYRGLGTTNLEAPDLTTEGLKKRGLRFQIQHLRSSCLVPNSPMPPFASLGDRNLTRLANFLEAAGTR